MKLVIHFITDLLLGMEMILLEKLVLLRVHLVLIFQVRVLAGLFPDHVD